MRRLVHSAWPGRCRPRMPAALLLLRVSLSATGPLPPHRRRALGGPSPLRRWCGAGATPPLITRPAGGTQITAVEAIGTVLALRSPHRRWLDYRDLEARLTAPPSSHPPATAAAAGCGRAACAQRGDPPASIAQLPAARPPSAPRRAAPTATAGARPGSTSRPPPRRRRLRRGETFGPCPGCPGAARGMGGGGAGAGDREGFPLPTRESLVTFSHDRQR